MTALSEELRRERWNKNISPLCGNVLDFYWDLVWSFFAQLPAWQMLHTEAATYEQVKMGALQVWAYSDTEIRGIMATRINTFSKASVLEVLGVMGVDGLDFMDELDDVCEHLARREKCTYITAWARPGMERTLSRKHRAAKVATVLFRPVGLLRSS